ncbi:ABC transporter permease [Oleiphilus messinensis]|uniref:ABC transporter permease n=1 Tax=Oleiphilus messinensis TaxID=141451 RepID=A0A1Y0I2K2_9GAMM|nr:iron chelate uptake ABC transporter family permease subunit [Oleiphilus messinensis]ARU54631.1 ABC transporter permease [Oleiphilus messinensis]
MDNLELNDVRLINSGSSKRLRTYFASPPGRLAAAVAIAVLSVLLFLTLNVKAGWEFTLMFRGKKLLTLLAVAFAISVASLLFQTLTQNRILTPAIMGFDSLYMLIQTTMVFLLGSFAFSDFNVYGKWLIEVSVMTGSLCSLYLFVLYRQQQSLFVLVLVGVILGVFFHSLSALLQRMMNPTEFTVLQDALFASFNAADSHLLILSGIMIAITCLFCFRMHAVLDTVALGQPIATNLGISYKPFLLLTLALISVLVSVATALVGPVTFFGLLVVNLAYYLAGTSRHRYLIPMSVTIGVICLVAGEVILQHGFSFNTRLSILIEFIGGLFFLILVLNRRFA